MTDSGAPVKAHMASDRAAFPMGILLWILVACALAYGVVQTLTKVVALFG